MERGGRSPENDISSFFLVSLLSKKMNLDDRVKRAVVRHAPRFNIHDAHEVRTALLETLARISRQDLAPMVNNEREWRRASEIAEKWVSRGILLVSDEFPLPPTMKGKLADNLIFGAGNRRVLAEKIAALLCSRQPRRIAPNASVLTAIDAAAKFIITKGYTLVSSYGTVGYNAVNCFTYGRPLIIVCPEVLPHMKESAALSKFLDAYDGLIDPENTLFVSSVLPSSSAPRDAVLLKRDELVAAMATLICVAAMREGGNVHRIVCDARKKGIPLKIFSASHSLKPRSTTTRPGIARPRPSKQPAYGASMYDAPSLGTLTPASAIESMGPYDNMPAANHSESIESNYLYHYTRSCPGPWPGQTQAQYWRSLIHDEPHAAHSGFDTLCRILEEKLIRGASRFIRGKESVVCLTELPPTRLSSLARWRRGLTRWAVEPYGIGIDRAALIDYGARPVQYGTEGDFSKLPPEQKYLFQVQRSRCLLWDVEREWRVKGNIDLSVVPHDRIVILVAEHAEMEMIQCRFDLRTVVVGDLNGSTSLEDSPLTSRVHKDVASPGPSAKAL